MKFDAICNTITSERLLLILFQPSDTAAVTHLCNNYNIYKNTLYLPFPYSEEDALAWIANHLDNYNTDKSYEFAITDRRTGELYGAIALTNNHHFNHGEMAFWIGEQYWGNGYATEASKAMLTFAFTVKQLHKVFARHFHTNQASGKVIQNLGMTKEGVLREHVQKENQYLDLVYYGMLQHEFTGNCKVWRNL
ncbi:GNAT family N-acetyltransferase [Alkalihalobacterium bogoriense]|uniref:GNAT family N-acetyltransferase n=1 Tax=Alkalihalobacterium bogoriense TaxID=246272 RepID=UPI00047CD357|nr:GNAT family N-acetyltransferase [Alkalihalobacterium bogoriense]